MDNGNKKEVTRMEKDGGDGLGGMKTDIKRKKGAGRLEKLANGLNGMKMEGWKKARFIKRVKEMADLLIMIRMEK